MKSTMKALTYKAYGSPDVLEVQEFEKPTPADNEILIKIQATNINFGDMFVRNFKAVSPRQFTMPALLWLPTRITLGINKPNIKILGSEFAGDVVAIGKDVTRFKVGDPVLGYRGITMGASAEYLCVAEDSLVVHKPDNIRYEEATTVPYGALTAISLLRKANIQAGQKVLINGASGSIGSAAVQLAKHYGAEVTGVCGTARMEMVKALGADHVVDYSQEDFTQNGETYDLILDVLNKSSFDKCKHSLNSGGIYLLASFKFKQLRQMLWTSFFGDKKVICALSDESLDDMLAIKDLVDTGAIKAVIDRCYPIEQAAEAHRYIEAGHKRGSVVLKV